MILFKNKEYKTREILLPEFGNVLISEIALIENLLDKNGAYVSEEALHIDEKIFFFVDFFEIELSNKKLVKLILESII